ncbi:MAG: hypothetical protein KatS3mg124_0716 [Porticoccaceae bacterium]|nr:MAG: hypothetical protein KatS3mg124_0716 [Porticoccaceae bacterium]
MLPRRVWLSPDALFQDLEGEGVVLDLASASYFGVEGPGVRLWQLLAEDPDLARALDVLEREYEVERARLEADVADFIAQLVEAGLATVE